MNLVLYLDIPEVFRSPVCLEVARRMLFFHKPEDNIHPGKPCLSGENGTLPCWRQFPPAEVWEDHRRTTAGAMRRVMEHRGVPGDGTGLSTCVRTGHLCCTLTLQRYRVYDAGKRAKTEVPTSYPCPGAWNEKAEKSDFISGNTLYILMCRTRCRNARRCVNIVNIEPLLSEADKKLLAETECDKGESLLERIAEGDCCRVRARCWTTDKESGKWMRVLSVDI